MTRINKIYNCLVMRIKIIYKFFTVYMKFYETSFEEYIHSVENLVELAATSNSSAILSELNKSYSDGLKNNLSSTCLSSRMESFIKSLSSANLFKSGLDSQQALGSLLHESSSNIFDSGMFYLLKTKEICFIVHRH